MIIKFECVFQDVRLAEVPEASHLVLIDFRTRVRILTVPSVKLQVPQPTLHLLFFLKISGELFPETDLKFSAHSKKKKKKNQRLKITNKINA